MDPMRITGTVPQRENPIIDLGHNLRVPTFIDVQGTDVNGYDLTMKVEYTPSSGRYECRTLTLTTPDAEITGESLRSIPVQNILKDGVVSALSAVTALNMGVIPQDVTEGGPTTSALSWVSYVYRVALILGESPVQGVAGALNLPKSTANRWITRARDRGLLDVQDKRGRRDREDSDT